MIKSTELTKLSKIILKYDFENFIKIFNSDGSNICEVIPGDEISMVSGLCH